VIRAQEIALQLVEKGQPLPVKETGHQYILDIETLDEMRQQQIQSGAMIKDSLL